MHCKLSINFLADVLAIFSSSDTSSDPLDAQSVLSSPDRFVDEEFDREVEDVKSTSKFSKSAENLLERLENAGMTYWLEVLIIDPDFWLVENPSRLDSPVLSLQVRH